MYSQGALAYDSRHYIALIAAARHKCFFLVKKQETEFKLHNGNAEWLKGIDFIPQKIKDLYEINKLLAHRPWLLNHKHIEVN
jgi:sestrin